VQYFTVTDSTMPSFAVTDFLIDVTDIRTVTHSLFTAVHQFQFYHTANHSCDIFLYATSQLFLGSSSSYLLEGRIMYQHNAWMPGNCPYRRTCSQTQWMYHECASSIHQLIQKHDCVLFILNRNLQENTKETKHIPVC